VLGEWFAASIGSTVPIDALALFTEPAPGALFALQAVYPLRPVPLAGRPPRAASTTDSKGTR
jgi:hypothetical protein